jgi:nitroreductase
MNMSVRQALTARYSCRSFTAEPVTRAQVEAVVAAASRAPSWANTQPWEVFVAGGETLERIRQGYLRRAEEGVERALEIAAPASWPEAHRTRTAELMRVRSKVLGIDPVDADARRRLMQRNFSLFGAPAVAWLCLDKALSPWSLFDLGSFAQSLMLEATELGLDSVPAVMLAAYPDIVRAELGVPDALAIAIGIALGHAEREDPLNKLRSPRRPLAEILTVRGL